MATLRQRMWRMRSATQPHRPHRKFGSWVLDDVSCGKVDNKSSSKSPKEMGGIQTISSHGRFI